MQVTPAAWAYVESVLIARPIPHDLAGNVRVGIALLRELLREFAPNRSLALAAYLQGSHSVRTEGLSCDPHLRRGHRSPHDAPLIRRSATNPCWTVERKRCQRCSYSTGGMSPSDSCRRLLVNQPTYSTVASSSCGRAAAVPIQHNRAEMASAKARGGLGAVAAGLLVCLATAAVSVGLGSTGAGEQSGTTVATDRGPVRGKCRHGMRVFLGIPYAAPRWVPCAGSRHSSIRGGARSAT